LPLAFLLVVLAVVIGGIIGAIAGFFGGWVDSVLMRVVDIVFAFPAIVLAMVVTAVLGPGLQNAVLALALVTWPTYAGVVRGLVVSAGHGVYVQSARLLGASTTRALRKDIAPNVVGPVLVLGTLDIGNAVLLLAGLSFLGLGAQPPDPEWGSMVSSGTTHFEAWWIGTFPGLAIFTLVLAFNFLGDSLRDAIDPRSTWGSGERA
jgi:peptide/nickel transport system permease protein